MGAICSLRCAWIFKYSDPSVVMPSIVRTAVFHHIPVTGNRSLGWYTLNRVGR